MWQQLCRFYKIFLGNATDCVCHRLFAYLHAVRPKGARQLGAGEMKKKGGGAPVEMRRRALALQQVQPANWSWRRDERGTRGGGVQVRRGPEMSDSIGEFFSHISSHHLC